MIIKKDEVRKQLDGIFSEKFKLDLLINNDQYADEELLGGSIKLRASDLVYLFVRIEDVFDIKLDQEDIAKGVFKTYNGILNAIIKQLGKKDAIHIETTKAV